MIYLETLKKYAFTFLKVLLFTAVFSLIYLFYLFAAFKLGGEKNLLLQSILNYLAFLINSLPFVVILSSILFFSFSGGDRLYILKMLPLINAFNTIILSIFFISNLKFMVLYENKNTLYHSAPREGYLNIYGPYRFYYELNEKGLLKKGIVFYRNPYILNSIKVKDDNVSLSTSYLITKTSLVPNALVFNVNTKEKLISLRSTSFSPFLLKMYEEFNIKMKSFFDKTFKSVGIVFSIVAIYILFLGFTGFVVGISSFFGKNDVFFLALSTMLVLSLIFFSILPGFLSLTHLIKLGIKNKFFEVLLASLIVGVFAGMLGYGTIELKFLLTKISGRR
ncbi:MAG: hypothetical protein ACP5QT_07980 [Brevinematia bacterium]